MPLVRMLDDGDLKRIHGQAATPTGHGGLPGSRGLGFFEGLGVNVIRTWVAVGVGVQSP
jgi:hypothetical protein